MSKFTSHCAGDIGVVINDHEVVAIAFIKNDPNTRIITHVEVYNIRAGGGPIVFPNLAEALTAMQDIASCLEVWHELLLQSEAAKALKFIGETFLESRITCNKED